MKIKHLIATVLLACGVGWGQGQFSGGGSTLPPATGANQCLLSVGAGSNASTWGSCSGTASTNWSALVPGTNTTGAFLIGSGASLAPTGTGAITASNLAIASQTGLLSFTGITSTNRIKTVRDAADTLLELNGSYTPTGTWNWDSATVTWPAGTSSALGSVSPDGTTITNVAGAISVTYGTAANTAAQGNDSRIGGALPKSGGTMTGLLQLEASASGGAGLNCGVGTTPTSPNNGDFWCTSAGVFSQINGSTVQLSGGGGGSGTVTSGSGYAATIYTSGAGTSVFPAAGLSSDSTGNNWNVAGQITVGGSSGTCPTCAGADSLGFNSSYSNLSSYTTGYAGWVAPLQATSSASYWIALPTIAPSSGDSFLTCPSLVGGYTNIWGCSWTSGGGGGASYLDALTTTSASSGTPVAWNFQSNNWTNTLSPSATVSFLIPTQSGVANGPTFSFGAYGQGLGPAGTYGPDSVTMQVTEATNGSSPSTMMVNWARINSLTGSPNQFTFNVGNGGTLQAFAFDLLNGSNGTDQFSPENTSSSSYTHYIPIGNNVMAGYPNTGTTNGSIPNYANPATTGVGTPYNASNPIPANYITTPVASATTATTATTATNATNVATTGGSSSSSTFYLGFVSSNTSGNYGVTTTGAFTAVPSTGVLSATGLTATSTITAPDTGTWTSSGITLGAGSTLALAGSSSGTFALGVTSTASTLNFGSASGHGSITAGGALTVTSCTGCTSAGGGTVTSVATTAPIIGGTFTTPGTISLENAVGSTVTTAYGNDTGYVTASSNVANGDIATGDSSSGLHDSGVQAYVPSATSGAASAIWSNGWPASPENGIANVTSGLLTNGTMYATLLDLKTPQYLGHATVYTDGTSLGETLYVCVYSTNNVASGSSVSLIYSANGSVPTGTANPLKLSGTQTLLQPGLYWVAYEQTGTTAGAFYGYGTGSNIRAIANNSVTREGTTANAISGSTCPSTLGAISPSTAAQQSVAWLLEP